MRYLKTIFKNYFYCDVLLFFILGLSSATPLALLGKTLEARMNDSQLSLAAIGSTAQLMLPYALKFLIAPLIDCFPLGYSVKLKKNWGFLFQIGLLICILFIASLDVATEQTALFRWCFALAVFGAGQDIVIDALRIDVLNAKQLKAASSTYQFGSRIGLLLTGAGLIALSAVLPWQVCYYLAAVLVFSGIVAMMFIHEKATPHKAVDLNKLIVLPFQDFAKRNKEWFLLLLFIILYKVCNTVLGKMAYSFYFEIGFTKEEIALVSGTIGPFITLIGVALGGVVMLRVNYLKLMMYLGFVEILTSLAFAELSVLGNNIWGFFSVILFDNIVGGMGGAVFVAFLSSLCSKTYSATQYALLTSLMMFAMPCIASYSGVLASYFGWPQFFILTGVAMIPALFVLMILILKSKKTVPSGSEVM